MRLENGSEVVAHYGSEEAEYQALVDAVGIAVRNWPDLLRVRGEDRKTFLNGKVTCEIEGIEPGGGAYGFFLDAKGHIQADTVIRVLEDAVWLELPAGRGHRIAEHLSRFIVIDRVEVEPMTDLEPLTLVGPRVEDLLESFSGVAPPPERPWQVGWLAADHGNRVLVSADGRWGVPSFTFWPSACDAEELLRALLEAGRDHDARLVGYRALDRLRIEAAIPWFGADFGEANLPQETGQGEAVSFTKGCYLGQEVVARLHYRGQVQKVLCGVTIEAEGVPSPGTSIVFEGRKAGMLTSAARSPRMRTIAGIAMLHRKAAGLGARLELEGVGRARVSKTPLREEV